jgi:hypothetical protein
MDHSLLTNGHFVSGCITQNWKLRTQNSVYGPYNEDKILVSRAIND